MKKKKSRTREDSSFKELIEIVAKLRDPKNGCPWDLEQTHKSLIPYMLEEAHEVADAIRQENDNEIKEELGDLLLQIILHSQIAKEEKRFDINDINNSISKKLIRRHPHVFNNKKFSNTEEVKKEWREIKINEKNSKYSTTPFTDQIASKVRSQSALSGGVFISKECAEIGFEWEHIDQIWTCLYEEIDEFKEALKNKNLNLLEEELGDIFFTLINIARWYQLSPEESLVKTNKKILKRFQYIESKMHGNLSNQKINSFRNLWKSTKENLKEEDNSFLNSSEN
tara:strand:- start:980 stop:1828 length:849 start_codon:yes stop_codon:yes gene_type:complete